MKEPTSKMADEKITRERLTELLNEDLSREYQAIIAYVVYSQVLKGAEYMNIADQLEAHAHDELKHALPIRQYRDRVRQCEALGEFAMAEQIRQILTNEQDHQIDLATALGEEAKTRRTSAAELSVPHSENHKDRHRYRVFRPPQPMMSGRFGNGVNEAAQPRTTRLLDIRPIVGGARCAFARRSPSVFAIGRWSPIQAAAE
jgi:bacterioferritin